MVKILGLHSSFNVTLRSVSFEQDWMTEIIPHVDLMIQPWERSGGYGGLETPYIVWLASSTRRRDGRIREPDVRVPSRLVVESAFGRASPSVWKSAQGEHARPVDPY